MVTETQVDNLSHKGAECYLVSLRAELGQIPGDEMVEHTP